MSSGKYTDISKDRSASILNGKKLLKHLRGGIIVFLESCDSLTLKRSHYETSNFRCSYQSARCNISEDLTPLLHFCENSNF